MLIGKISEVESRKGVVHPTSPSEIITVLEPNQFGVNGVYIVRGINSFVGHESPVRFPVKVVNLASETIEIPGNKQLGIAYITQPPTCPVEEVISTVRKEASILETVNLSHLDDHERKVIENVRECISGS